MSYFFNKQILLQKAKSRYRNCGGREKAGECSLTNEDVLKEKAKNKYKTLSEQEKEAKREYTRNKHRRMKEKSKSNGYQVVKH